MHNLSENFSKISMIVNQILAKDLNSEGNIPKPGRNPKYSDAKVISLALTAEVSEVDSEYRFFINLSENYRSIFPDLIHRTQFNRRRKALFYWINTVREKLVNIMEPQSNRHIVDSMPLAICKFSRAKRLKICQEEPISAPAYGFCAAQNIHYFGYKFHAVCSVSGVVKNFDLSKANHHDIKYLEDIRELFPGTELLGDLGYRSGPLQLELFEVNDIELITPMRSNEKNYQPQNPLNRRQRKRIETMFSQFIDFLNLTKNYAKSFVGLAARILTKITSFTILQYFNILNGRPLNHVKHAIYF